ncbi:MAG: efflux RND transporter periplasmic adaptor subunit [Candidatus Hydrogenedentes bacterium]|nr:efflux RND transporter periplasmic adaptor subunit [Candidatus Hydrogenedentota bacterium]
MTTIRERVKRLRPRSWRVVLAAVLILAGFYLGTRWRPTHVETGVTPSNQAEGSTPATTEAATIWTCSMHPNIRQPRPGKCPICGMDLIPVTSGDSGADAGPRSFSTTEAARQLMNIQTARVERRFVTTEIRMVGKIEYDETKLAYITSRVPGRLDRLYVDYTGVPVKKGDHLVYLYSPELLVAQEELQRAARAIRNLSPGAPDSLRKAAQATLEASRRKLSLWGVTDQQIADAEKGGASTDHITIFAPVGGTVVQKNALEGMYVETGTQIYVIADLGEVWVKMDAYESDLPWLHYGQKVTFATEAYPGETFSGRIAFIDPILNPMTRTAKVRVNVPNPDGRLKPEMFVRSVVQAQVAPDGRVMDPDLAGKWISPMHPQIIKDGPGTCDICGMPLVRAEDLGYVPATADESSKPLVIPAAAPLITGKRAIVYVETTGADRPTFEGREVKLGPRAGDDYIVESGLAEGEMVVTNGNFKIDSALQILAKPSMMNPEGGVAAPVHDHGTTGTPPSATAAAPETSESKLELAPEAFRLQLGKVLEAYYGLQAALASDNLQQAVGGVKGVQEALAAVDMKLLTGDAHTRWMKRLAELQSPLEASAKAPELDALRTHFAVFSERFVEVLKTYGRAGDRPAYALKCPMALNNQGAVWLQPDKEVRNPYFGASMLNCGQVIGTLGPTQHQHTEGAGHE